MKTLSVAVTVVLAARINCLDRVDLISWLRVEHLNGSTDDLNFVRSYLFQKMSNESLIPCREFVQMAFYKGQSKRQCMPICINLCETQLLSVNSSSNTGQKLPKTIWAEIDPKSSLFWKLWLPHLLYADQQRSWVFVIENMPELFGVWIQVLYLPNPIIGSNSRRNSWVKIVLHQEQAPKAVQCFCWID